jgi:tetratricopeptide (TPR) repeat protein
VRLFRPPLVGHEAPRQQLAERVVRLGEGEGGALVLAGPAGAGKTRLALEAMAHARDVGVAVVAGGCAPLDAPEAGVPSAAHQLLSHLAATEAPEALADHVPALAAQVPALRSLAERHGWPTRLDLPLDQLREAWIEAVLGMMAAANHPVLWVVDDVQWADLLTEAVLERTSREGQGPILLVATARGDVPRWAADEVVVGIEALDDAEADGVLSGILGAPPPPEVAGWAKALAAGNPFLLGEAMRVARNEGALDGRCAVADLPGDAAMLLQRRLDGHDPSEQAVLEATTIGGDGAPFAVLLACTGLEEPDLLDAIRALEDAEVLVPTPRGPAFVHGRLRELAAKQMRPDRSARLHRKAAQALEDTGGSAAARARHWDHGGEHARARPLYRRAAEEALARYQPDTAVRMLEAALALDDCPPAEEVGLRTMLAGRVLTPLGRLPHAEAALAPAFELRCAPSDEAELWLAAVDLDQLLGRMDAAADRLAHVQRLADAIGDANLSTRLWMLKAEQCHRTGDVEGAKLAATRALTHVDAATDDPRVFKAHYTAASIARAARAHEEAREAAEVLQERARANGWLRLEALGLELDGLLALDRGDADHVVDRLERAAEIFARVGDQRHRVLSLGNLAGAHHIRGDYEASAAMLEQCVATMARLGDARSTAMQTRNLALLQEQLGRIDQARGPYRDSFEPLLELGDAEAVGCLAAAARLERVRADDVEAAAALLRRAKAFDGEVDNINRIELLAECCLVDAALDRDPRPAVDQLRVLVDELERVPMFLVEPVEQALALVDGPTAS